MVPPFRFNKMNPRGSHEKRGSDRQELSKTKVSLEFACATKNFTVYSGANQHDYVCHRSREGSIKPNVARDVFVDRVLIISCSGNTVWQSFMEFL